MNWKKKLVGGAMLAALGVTAQAAPEAGDWEIVFSNAGGRVDVFEDNGGRSVRLNAQVGYFLTMNHEVGGEILASWWRSDMAGSNSNVDFGAFYRYNFVSAEDTSWLYAGLEVGDFGVRTYRPHVGWKLMLTESVAFDVNGGISHRRGNWGNSNDVDARFGFSIIF